MDRDYEIASVRRTMYGLLTACGLMSVVMIVPEILIRQTAVVTVESIYAARECRSRDSRFFGPRFRSSDPEYPGGYCGIVITDHGSFELPETTWLPTFGRSREALFDLFEIGCSYEVTVVGPGIKLSEGRMSSNHNMTVRYVTPLGECQSDNGE